MTINGISYWQLDENSGLRVDGYGPNDLTPINDKGRRPGRVNYAGNFIRTMASTRYEIENIDQVGLNPGFNSFSTWAQIVSDEVGVVGEKRTILSRKSLMETSWSLYFSIGTGLVFETSHNGITEDKLIYSMAIPTTGWTFVGISYNGSTREKRIIVAGVEAANGTAIHSTGLFSGDLAFTIGGLDDGGWNWDGGIDEVGYCAKVLTDAEWSQINANPTLPEFIILNKPVAQTVYSLHGKVEVFTVSGSTPDDLRGIKPEIIGGRNKFIGIEDVVDINTEEFRFGEE